MIKPLVSWFSQAHPELRERFYTFWYQFMARAYPRQDWKFMNYGFAPLPGQEGPLQLREGDEINRYYIQLYHHVASQVDLQGLAVLEVGSGRGGGAEYIKRYLDPERMVGLDLSENVIKFCQQVYDLPGLSYQAGDAQALPFPEASFDVIVNVESSHCYGSMSGFLEEVKRVLRPGGYFLLADFRRSAAVLDLKKSLAFSGLTVIQEQNITPNIIEALRLDQDQKTAFINETIHKPLAGFFHQFAGSRGSTISNRLKSGETVYLSFVLQNRFGAGQTAAVGA